MFTLLSFQEIINRLPTVATKVWMHKGDVYPVGAALAVLPYQLVKWQVGLDVVEPLAAFLHVATDAEVCRLPSHVLRVRDAADGTVQLLTSGSAGYGYRLVHRLAQRFEHVGSEIHQ